MRNSNQSSENKGRMIVLEDIKTMRQQNNWCSWVVKVFAGQDGSTWKSCGIGILTFRLDGKPINTFSELEKSKGKDWDKDKANFRIDVKQQRGLNSPSDKEVASESTKQLLRRDRSKEYILDCDLSTVENIDWDMNMVIFWTQKDINLHVSLSFIQSEIFVESWQLICTFFGLSLRRNFNFPTQHNIGDILRILGEDNEHDEKKILLACFVVNHEFLEELFSIYIKVKAKEDKDQKQLEMLQKIQFIIAKLVEHNNNDLLMTFISERIFPMFLQVLEDIEKNSGNTCNFKAFYLEKCGRAALFEMKDTFVNAVETKFRLLYLKDYVFCVSSDEGLMQRISILETRLDLSVIYNIILKFDEFWKQISNKFETDILKVQSFFVEFLKVYKAVGPKVMANFSTIFMTNEAYKDIVQVQWKSTRKKKFTKNDLITLYTSFEILSAFCRFSVKGTIKIFNTLFKSKNGEEFRFMDIVIKCLLYPDYILWDNVRNYFSRLLEQIVPQINRIKFVNIINSYTIPKMINYVKEQDTIPTYFITIMNEIITQNLCEDEIQELIQDKSRELNKSLSTKKILITTGFLLALNKHMKPQQLNCKPFIISVCKILSCFLNDNNDRTVSEMINLKYVDFIWNILVKNLKRKNLMYSMALSLLKMITTKGYISIVNYIGITFGDEIEKGKLEHETVIRGTMNLYRKHRSRKNSFSSVEGCFASEKDSIVITPSESMKVTPQKIAPPLNFVHHHSINPAVIVDDERELKRLKTELVEGQSNGKKEDNMLFSMLGKRQKSQNNSK